MLPPRTSFSALAPHPGMGVPCQNLSAIIFDSGYSFLIGGGPAGAILFDLCSMASNPVVDSAKGENSAVAEDSSAARGQKVDSSPRKVKLKIKLD